MANCKAQIKTIQKDKERRLRNRRYRSVLHTAIRKLDEAIQSGDKEAAKAELKKSCAQLDKTSSRGVIHANKAARTKSRLNARVAKMA